MLTYTSDGKMMLILTYGERKPLTSGDRRAASVAERAEAYATSFAYGGHFSITDNKIVHHVEISTVENWVDTDLVRQARFEGAKLILTTPTLSVGGKQQITELVWERMK